MFDDDFDPMPDDEFMEYGLMLMEDMTPEEAWRAYQRGEIDRSTLNTLLDIWEKPKRKPIQEVENNAIYTFLMRFTVFVFILSAILIVIAILR